MVKSYEWEYGKAFKFSKIEFSSLFLCFDIFCYVQDLHTDSSIQKKNQIKSYVGVGRRRKKHRPDIVFSELTFGLWMIYKL